MKYTETKSEDRKPKKAGYTFFLDYYLEVTA